MEGGSGGSPAAAATTATCRMLRSPSHESVTTDLSLFSVSSLAASEAARPASHLVRFKPSDLIRGPSPNPDKSLTPARPPDIPEIHWFEEENDLIRSCAALSSALGLQKSFSTSDISQLPGASAVAVGAALGRSWAVSELALSTVQRCSFLSEHPRLEHASRSCSTWVAVGDVASTSQLPSPHGGHSTTATSAATSAATSLPPPPPSFTPADLIRSVNKKVRQNYIRRRLMTTYKALERLSQSEFNLDRLEVAAAAATAHTPVPPSQNVHLRVPGASGASSQNAPPTAAVAAATLLRVVATNSNNNNLPLTITDVERERGKPLSKYDRNMMIFNWLHTLDNASFEGIQWE